MYSESALSKLQAACRLEEMNEAEIRDLILGIGNAGGGLNHLPFCRLCFSSAHKFGVLKGWLKAKSFKPSAGIVL